MSSLPPAVSDPLVYVVAFMLVPGGASEFLSDADGVIRFSNPGAAVFVAEDLERRGCFWAVMVPRSESQVKWAEARDQEARP